MKITSTDRHGVSRTETPAEREARVIAHRAKPPARYMSMKGNQHVAYCSPWCGFDCHLAAFDQATREAQALADRMNAIHSPGWVPHVWENCGWNYYAIKGDGLLQIHPDRAMPSEDRKWRGVGGITGGWEVRGYTAWVQTSPQFISNKNESPITALDEAISMCRAHIAVMNAALATALAGRQ